MPAIPAASYDADGRQVVEIGLHRRGIVEELEKAHIYIEQLKNTIEELRSELAHRNEEFERRLAELEGIAAQQPQ